MKNLIRYLSIVCITGIVLFQSCKEDVPRPTFPISALIFHSVVDKQVAFTALTHSAVSWSWDFGDGKTSAEENPVHVYDEGGYYIATLTATDNAGNTATSEVKLAIALTPYALLTGDHTADDYNGKTWKLTTNHKKGGDYLAYADLNLTAIDPDITPLPTGAFGLYLDLGEVYDDTYTFYFDGKYEHDVKDDHAAFGGIAHQLKTNGGAGIVKMSAIPDDFPVCTAQYTPETGATFTYIENEDFTVSSVFGPPSYSITFRGVSTMDFSGTEFVGFMDYQRKVIIKQITEDSMTLIMFASLDPKYYPLNTTAFVLSFEVVNK
ncbi:MAG: PKD domain-containing protein [Prolixibacteraceae bacterium]|jgi:hypothetical protein